MDEIATDVLDCDSDFVFVDPQAHRAENDVIYSQELTTFLEPGSSILIKASIQPHCRRFAINLLCARPNSKADIVFHFNPRLALRYIVRNSRINNSWGEEETTSIEKFSLERNESFVLQIVTTEREFLISINGRHVCAYVYRVPLEKVNRIEVEGLEVESIQIIKQVKSYPSVEGFLDIEDVSLPSVNHYPTNIENITFTVPMKIASEEQNSEEQEEQSLIVPITGHLPEGFKTGWQLEITGQVKLLPSAFYVNLQQGNTLWPHPIIPLHLNPRFHTSYGQHLCVRNCWMDGEWGTEERTAGFQFIPGKKFHLVIIKNPDHFAVWVDGTLIGEFKFKTPVDQIDTVYIHGDVKIFAIYLKDPTDDKFFTKSRENINNSL